MVGNSKKNIISVYFTCRIFKLKYPFTSRITQIRIDFNGNDILDYA